MNILEKILSGEKITEKINIEGRGEFEIAFPLPSDLRKIEIRVSKMTEGRSLNTFDNLALTNFRICATLEEMLVNAPKWFEKLKSIEECPDEGLLADLYRGYLQLYKQTQEDIGKSKFNRKDKKCEDNNNDETVGDGTFSNITYGSEDEKPK